ncbi:hypothetical protein BGZ52_013401, partial [Haplosporangium bisporale]
LVARSSSPGTTLSHMMMFITSTMPCKRRSFEKTTMTAHWLPYGCRNLKHGAFSSTMTRKMASSMASQPHGSLSSLGIGVMSFALMALTMLV